MVSVVISPCFGQIHLILHKKSHGEGVRLFLDTEAIVIRQNA